jgi:hypothetical protein
MPKSKDVKEGVEDAMAFWLSQHPVSMGDILQDSIKKATTEWFDLNEDKIIETMTHKPGICSTCKYFSHDDIVQFGNCSCPKYFSKYSDDDIPVFAYPGMNLDCVIIGSGTKVGPGFGCIHWEIA